MTTDQSNKHLTCLMTGQKVLFLQDPQSPQGKAEGNVDGREETKYVLLYLPTLATRNSGCFLRELVGFDQRLVTRSPQIGKDI